MTTVKMQSERLLSPEGKRSGWFAVQTKPRQEQKALDNLSRQGYAVYLPRITVQRRRRKQWQSVIEPLFPCYLFVTLDLAADDIAPIRSTIGVRGLVRFGAEPASIPAAVIEFIHDQEAQAVIGDSSPKTLFTAGDKVRVLNGPFAGLEAVYQIPEAEDRALLLISILGRQNSVAIKYDDFIPG